MSDDSLAEFMRSMKEASDKLVARQIADREKWTREHPPAPKPPRHRPKQSDFEWHAKKKRKRRRKSDYVRGAQ